MSETRTAKSNQKRPQRWWNRKRRVRLGVVAAILVSAAVTLGMGAKPAFASSAFFTNSGSTSTSGMATAASASVPSLAPMLTRCQELRLMGRLWYAALLGAAVGKERSTANHHPAGVRTLALVSLGSAAFTLVSMYGFGTAGRFDTSRMASAVASGIGFIGAGVITTTTTRNESVVHGLTTAAAVWISAAVGVTCGSGLYILATSLAAATLGFLRIGGNVKHKRSRYRRDTIAHMVETDPELLKKLIDWEKINLPDLIVSQTSSSSSSSSLSSSSDTQSERIEDTDDECLISKRYFPENNDSSSSRKEVQAVVADDDDDDEDNNDDYFYDGEDDEVIVISTAGGIYGNETEKFFGGDDEEESQRDQRSSTCTQRSSKGREEYDDDVAP